MTAGVVLLVLASAFVHALWNALLKRAREPELAVVGILVVSALTSAVTVVLVRAPIPSWTGLGWVAAAGVLEAAYFVTLARALARAPLGAVYTIVRGGALVVVWPVSVLVLGESLGATTAAGTLLVVLGLVAVGAADGIRGALSGQRLGWAAICALFVGGYNVSYKLALASGASPAFVNASLVVASVINLASIDQAKRRGALAALRAEPLRIVSAGVLGSIGFLVFLTAMQHTGAGVALTLRNTSILFAQMLAMMYGERPKPLAIAGALLVTAGAVALSL